MAGAFRLLRGRLGPLQAGPGPLWNGTGGSGGTPPQDPVRTGPKAIGRWAVVPERRFASDIDLVVDAHAFGGVAYVSFWVEGATVNVHQPGIHYYTDVNQNTLSPVGDGLCRYGYKLTLDHSAFIAQHAANNTIHIYATIVPVLGTVQSRTIGPFVLYPESTEHDYEVTIAPSGADYTTVQGAIDAMRALNALAPKFTFTQSGFYELVDGTGTHYTGAKGRWVLAAADGVTARLGRSSLNNSDVDWNPKVDNLELRGLGVVFDQQYVSLINCSSVTTGRNHWLNGCKVTNSVGTAYTLYWNLGPHPRGILDTPSTYGGAAGGYISDCVLEYVNSPIVNLTLAMNNRIHEPIERFANGTVYAFGNYVDYVDVSYFREQLNCFTVAYNGAATATMEITGGNNYGSGARYITLKENGVTIVGPLLLGNVPTDTYFLLSNLIAYLDSVTSADWVFTANADVDTRAAQFLTAPPAYSANPTNIATITSTPAQFKTWIDIHSGGWNINAAMQNAILRNNTVLGIAAGEFIPFLLDTGSAYDVLICNSVYGEAPLDIRFKISCAYSHFMVENIYAQGGIRFQTTGVAGGPYTWSNDPYSYFKNCAFVGVTADSGGIQTYPNRVNCYAQSLWTQGSADSGNFAGSTITGVVQNAAGGDFRPATTLINNPKTRINLFDGRTFRRSITDTVGPWSSNASAPNYYDFG